MFSAATKKERFRIIFVLGVMTISIGTLLLDSLWFQGIVSAEAWGYGFSAVFLAYALLSKDELILKFFGFGVVAGFAELVADHYLVATTGTLVYPADELFIWSSPAYMPFSWVVVLVEFGFLGWLLTKKFNLLLSGVILGILGALLVPLYEHWAIGAGWWYYHNTAMLGPVPYYIILAEGLLMIPVPYFMKKLETGKWPLIPAFGLAEGVVMLIACLIAIQVFA